MKKLIKTSIAIALATLLLCSSLSACFLQELTDSCTGASSPTPAHSTVDVDTPEPSGTGLPETQTPDASGTPGGEPTPQTDPSASPEDTGAASEQPTSGASPSANGETDAPNTGEAQPTPAQTTPAPETPTPVPTTPDVSGSVPIGTDDMPARFTMPTELYGLDARTVEAWFADAVFIGDSITIGWKNYNNLMLESDPNFFGQTRFLCEGSYGSGHALEPINETSMHPIYAGEQHFVWDSVQMMGARKVFILFGMNDLSIYGVDGAAANYEQVIDRILEVNPGVQLYIISAMYMYKGSEREILNNRNLYLYNRRLVELCARKGCEFVNIASHLIDENGFVPDEYSSDQYVHQTYKAYAVWADILRSLAARHLKGLPPVTFSLPN
ncbi:MAG: hypothetical protein IKI64_06655 [Clostridia bacterium]|nr:hypothetical protein [Clostridia bacterium]